jgi:hypothetical protein
MGKQKILYTVLVRKPEVIRALGRPSSYERMILKLSYIYIIGDY